MYLRFISTQRTNVRGVDGGIFRVTYDARHDTETPAFLRAAISSEVNWFCEHLPSPNYRHFEVRSRKVMRAVGICWFKADAREMIARAFGLKALLAECGYFITTQGTDNPGQILYKDAFQIIAKPRPSTPTKWG